MRDRRRTGVIVLSALIVFVLFCPGPQMAIAVNTDEQLGPEAEQLEKDQKEQADIKSAVLTEIGIYLKQFNRTCFGKYISIGDIELFRASADKRLWLIVGAKGKKLIDARGVGKAYHDTVVWAGLNDLKSASAKHLIIADLVLPFDPRNLDGDPPKRFLQQQTMMHEMTHHMEWLSGVKAQGSERNTNYQDQVVNRLRKWANTEKGIMEDKPDPACQFNNWQSLKKDLKQLEKGRAADWEKPDINLTAMNGFPVEFDDIDKAYLKGDCDGDCKEDLKTLASLDPRTFKAPSLEECDKIQKEREEKEKRPVPETEKEEENNGPFVVTAGSITKDIEIENISGSYITVNVTVFIDDELVREEKNIKLSHRSVEGASDRRIYRFNPLWEEHFSLIDRKVISIPNTGRSGVHECRIVVEESNGGSRVEKKIEFRVEDKTLNVARVRQEGEVWCWAASLQSILNYMGDPEIKACELVNRARESKWIAWEAKEKVIGRVDCCKTGPTGQACDFGLPVDSWIATSVQDVIVLKGYSMKYQQEAMTDQQLKRHIDSGNPLIIMIRPHMIVARGYRSIEDEDGNRKLYLHIMDPLLYPHYQLVAYEDLVKSRYLGCTWEGIVYDIKRSNAISEEEMLAKVVVNVPDAFTGIPFQARLIGMPAGIFIDWSATAANNISTFKSIEGGVASDWTISKPGKYMITAKFFSDEKKKDLIATAISGRFQVSDLKPQLALQSYHWNRKENLGAWKQFASVVELPVYNPDFGKPLKFSLVIPGLDVERMSVEPLWQFTDKEGPHAPGLAKGTGTEFRRADFDDLTPYEVTIKKGVFLVDFTPKEYKGSYEIQAIIRNEGCEVKSNIIKVNYGDPLRLSKKKVFLGETLDAYIAAPEESARLDYVSFQHDFTLDWSVSPGAEILPSKSGEFNSRTVKALKSGTHSVKLELYRAKDRFKIDYSSGWVAEENLKDQAIKEQGQSEQEKQEKLTQEQLENGNEEREQQAREQAERERMQKEKRVREQAERERLEADRREREQAEKDRRASALKAAQEKKIQEGQKLKENTQQVKKTATKPKSFTQLSEEEKKDFLDCVCGCGSSHYGTGYHPEPTESSYSPSCDDLANGPCLGGGRGGCVRSKMPAGGVCVTNCYAEYNVIPDSNTTNILTAENKKHQKPLKVTLAPDAKPIKALYGTTVSLTATVEGGQPGYTYSWSGQGDAKDNTYTFINTREPGTFAVAVTVNDSDGGSATAATSIVVEALTVTIEKILPAGNTVPVGGQASFKATVAGGTDVNYLWQPHPEVEFDPFEKSATTTATFRNPESVGVWVEVLVKDGAVMRSAGRSNVITLQVANPQWALEFIPASTRVGQPVKAKISPTGPQAAAISTAEMNFRWQLPANAKQTGTSQDDREITFVLHDTKPANISCTAATKRKNENLGGAGKTITAQEYAVKVSGPRGRQEFQIWKCETQLGGAPECGMKKVENQFAAGNEILFGATVEPLPEKPVSYNWTASPDGCSIASPFSRDIGMTCSSTGSYTVTVIAKSDGLEIGSSSASVIVTISQNDINNSNKSKEAYEKLQKAKELISQGKLDEGIVLIDEALRLDPKLTEAAALGQKWKSEKQDIMKHVERIKNLLPADDIAQAEQELAPAQKLHPKYAPVVEVEKILNEAKRISAEKKIKEQATTTTGGDPSKLSMLNRILDNRNKNSGISQPEATPRIAAIKKENTGALGSPEKNPNDSASRGGCAEETIVLHNNYQGVCSYTNSTSFTLVKATNITRIGIRFDTDVGGKTLSATLSRSNGYKIAVGTIARGECQGGWCEAIWNLDQVLKAGTYTFTADSTSICADPSGQTTLALYGCLYSQENVNGRQGSKPENAPAPPPAPSVTRVTPSPKADVQNLDEAIAKIERAIATFNSSIAELEARSKTLKGANNIAIAKNEIEQTKKYLPQMNAELNRLKALKQSNEKGQAASGNRKPEQKFTNPQLNGRDIDNCLHWGADCDQPAADYYCRQKGFSSASSFETVGRRPTVVMGDNKTCDDYYCRGFLYVVCH